MTVCTEEPEKVAILIIDELLAVIGQACVLLAGRIFCSNINAHKDYRSCTFIGIVQVHRLDFVTVFLRKWNFDGFSGNVQLKRIATHSYKTDTLKCRFWKKLLFYK